MFQISREQFQGLNPQTSSGSPVLEMFQDTNYGELAYCELCGEEFYCAFIEKDQFVVINAQEHYYALKTSHWGQDPYSIWMYL
jgi:hypothetical protein